MKKNNLLHPGIVGAVAALGHTEYFCVADCGLPIPKGTEIIDVSVSAGVPRFIQVLRAVASELVAESYIIAQEMEQANPAVLAELRSELPGINERTVSHAQFKELLTGARCVVRTGETSPYANVILVGGVNF